MKILAIETTGLTGSVAVTEDGETLATRELPSVQRSAKSLIPSLHELLNELTLEVDDLDAIAVAKGPGSFTGLRIGITAAKLLAWGSEKKLIGVDAFDSVVVELDFEALRARVGGASSVVASVGFDAQRGEAATRDYLIKWTSDNKPCVFSLSNRFQILSFKEWLGRERIAFDFQQSEERLDSVFPQPSQQEQQAIDVSAPSFVFCGAILERVQKKPELTQGRVLIDSSLKLPRARGVALVAWERARRGLYDDPWRILPIYSRRSTAEERALAKGTIE